MIEVINKNWFKHSIDTDNGSSGASIILHNFEKVIGIHRGGDRKIPINYGIFIG